jgi:beta-mannanase
MRKSTASLAAAVVVLAALLAYIGFVVTRSGGGAGDGIHGAAPPPVSHSASPALTPSTPPAEFPASGTVFLGLQTSIGPFDFAPVDTFASATGYRPPVLQFTQGWAHDAFNADNFNRVAERGMLPIVSWEPWDFDTTGAARHHGAQPKYRLAQITAGAFDSYIRSWADGIKNLGYPVGIRFAHEMNGFWYPWCESANGNRPGDYVKAFRHVHRIFTEAGADNVIWIWSPNVTYPGAKPLDRLYPGDKYVDWVGLSGYYGTEGMTGYQSFDAIFTGTLKQLRRFTKRPVVITETGATNQSGQQARWIRQTFQQLPKHPEIIGVIWFEVDKELDWRIAGNPASVQAFARGSTNKRYAVTWTTNTIARTTTSASPQS